MLKASTEHVAREIDHLRAAQGGAQELHAGFGQLMRFIEHRHFYAGQQLGHAAVAQRHVGKEQMVIHHHEVGGHGSLRAFITCHWRIRALAARQFARTRDERDHAGTLVHALDLASSPLCCTAHTSTCHVRTALFGHSANGVLGSLAALVLALPSAGQRREGPGLHAARQVTHKLSGSLLVSVSPSTVAESKVGNR